MSFGITPDHNLGNLEGILCLIKLSQGTNSETRKLEDIRKGVHVVCCGEYRYRSGQL